MKTIKTTKTILLLKANAANALPVVVYQNYFSCIQPKPEKSYDEIWLIKGCSESNIELMGRWKECTINPINNAKQIPDVFSSPVGSTWTYQWNLQGFMNERGVSAVNQIYQVNIDPQCCAGLQCGLQRELQRAVHTQTLGYINLDQNDINILNSQYGLGL